MISFFALPPEVRKVACTTNAPESRRTRLRKVNQTPGLVSSEEPATRLLYLALTKVAAKWHTMQDWKQMLNFWMPHARIGYAEPA